MPRIDVIEDQMDTSVDDGQVSSDGCSVKALTRCILHFAARLRSRTAQTRLMTPRVRTRLAVLQASDGKVTG